MSEVRKYPTIQSVQITMKSYQYAISTVQTVLTNTVKNLSKVAQVIYHQLTTNPETNTKITSTQNTRQNAQTLQQQALELAQKSNLPITESAQLAALVASHVYLTVNPETIQQNWTPLQSANSLKSAKLALDNYVQELEVQHQRMVVENLVLACNHAAIKVGFKPLQSSFLQGKVRLISHDETGRSLVTEIATNPDHPIQMATEIIGSSDHSCEQILDAFDAALKEEGVITAPPERKFTGGICELEAAQEFIRKQPIKKAQIKGKTSHKKISQPKQQQIKQGF